MNEIRLHAVRRLARNSLALYSQQERIPSGVRFCYNSAMNTFETALVWHLVADWLFQNEWQAVNKTNPRHPAAWVHSGIHLLGLLIIFPVWIAVGVAVTHFLIDLRVPLIWWRKLIKQTTDPKNPATIHVAFWGDQVLHILILAIATHLV